MSRDATYGASANLLKLMKMAMESFYGLLSFSEIQNKLEIHERTLARYVKVLYEVFPNYIQVKRGSELGREPSKERFLVFNRFELESRTGYQLAPLYLSRFFMSFLEGTLLDESLSDAVTLFESAVDQGKSDLPTGSFSQKFYAVGFGPKSYAQHDEIIDTLMQALVRQNVLKIEYQKPSADKPDTYILNPLTMVVYKQGLYLLASRSELKKLDPRFFAVERIKECKLLRDQRFAYPARFSPEQFCSSSFGIFHGKPEKVVLRFDEDIGRSYIEPRKWHADQKLEYRGDGSALLTLEVSGTQELFSWVLSFGSKVQVLEPDKLRQEVCDELVEMMKEYSPQSHRGHRG